MMATPSGQAFNKKNDFSKKNEKDFLLWLEKEGFPESTVKIFEGLYDKTSLGPC